MSRQVRERRGPAKAFLEWALAQETDECIRWCFAVDKDGYGQIWIGGREGRKVSVPRIVCEHFHGAAPPGTQVAHGECHDRSCINGRHLSWKTPPENARDKIRDGTNHPRRLTEREVRELRDQWKTGEWTLAELAEEFGLSSAKRVHAIVTLKSHRNVTFARMR